MMKFLTTCALMILLMGIGSTNAQEVTAADIRAVSQTETGIVFYGVNDLHELVQVGSLPAEFAFYGAETEATWQISGMDEMQVSPDGKQVVFSARHRIGEMEYHSDQMNDVRTAYFYEHGVFIYSDGQEAIDQIWKGYSWSGQIASPSWSPDGKYIDIRPRGLGGGDEFPPYIPTTFYSVADHSFSEIDPSLYITPLLSNHIRYSISCELTGCDQGIDTINYNDPDGNTHLVLALADVDGTENIEYSRVISLLNTTDNTLVLTETMSNKDWELSLRIIQLDPRDKEPIIWEQHFSSGIGFAQPAIEGIVSPDFNQILITGIGYVQSETQQEFFVVDLTTGLQTFDNFEVAGETCAAQWLDNRYLLFEQSRLDNDSCQHLWRTPSTDVWLADSMTQTITKLEVKNGDSIWLIPQTSQP